jgi:hypothetical protein
MNESATDEQKEIIIKICKEKNIAINADGPWPEPFTKWDAARMIETLREE